MRRLVYIVFIFVMDKIQCTCSTLQIHYYAESGIYCNKTVNILTRRGKEKHTYKHLILPNGIILFSKAMTYYGKLVLFWFFCIVRVYKNGSLT